MNILGLKWTIKPGNLTNGYIYRHCKTQSRFICVLNLDYLTTTRMFVVLGLTHGETFAARVFALMPAQQTRVLIPI